MSLVSPNQGRAGWTQSPRGNSVGRNPIMGRCPLLTGDVAELPWETKALSRVVKAARV